MEPINQSIGTETKDTSGPEKAVSSLGLLASIAALAGASCCVVPILLGSIGLGGGWLANLSPFVAYRPIIAAAAVIIIAIGWWLAVKRRSPRQVIVLLTGATVAVVSAILLSFYEAEISRLVVAWMK